jgi:outer membrane protein
MNRFNQIIVSVTTALLLATSPVEADTRLSLDDAIALSLKNNPDIKVAAFAPRKAEADVRQQKGAFDPVFSLFGGYGRDKTPQAALTLGPFRRHATAEASLAGRLSLGTEYALRYGTTRLDGNSEISPKSSSSAYAELELRQPLLRGFGRDVNEAGIDIARGNERIADLAFRRKTEAALVTTIDAYWRLVRAHKSLAVARESLQLAEQLVQRTQARVAAGDLPTIELTQARASVAAREEAVILGEAEVGNANDALARQIAVDPRDVFGESFVPTDEPTTEPIALQQRYLIDEALRQRAELQAARQAVTNAEVALTAARNLRRPDLSAVASAGTGGLSSDWSSAQAELARDADDQHRWSVGVVFSMPIGNRTADGAYQKALLALDEARASLRSLELQVTEDVRSALRNLDASTKRVEATRRASELAREQLTAGEKRLATGLSTAFEVLRLQTDLAAAQNAEIAAMIAYRTNAVRVELATGDLFGHYVAGA